MSRLAAFGGTALVAITCASCWGFGILNAAAPELPRSPKAPVQLHAAAVAALAENVVPQSRADVLRALFSRDFQALTRLFEAKQAQVENDIRREVDLARITVAFDTADPAVTPLLDAWIEATPRSFAPHIARGMHRAAVAWARRGTKWADDTSEEQFRGMQQALAGVVTDGKAALERNARVTEAYRLLIRAAMGFGRNDVCIQIAGRGIAIMPASMRIRMTLAYCLLPRWGGSYELLEALAAQADRHVAVNPALSALHGFVEWDRGRLEDDKARALEYYGRALAKGEHWYFYQDRAWAHLALRRYQEALADVNRGLELQPDDPELLMQRARAYAGLGRRAEESKDLQLVTLIDPTNSDLIEFRDWELRSAVYDGQQLSKANDFKRAIARITEGISLAGGSAEAHYWRGRAHLLSENHQNALADFEVAIRLDPRHFESYRNIDFIFAKRGQWDEIIRRWTTYLELEPANGRAYFERAGAAHHKGDQTAAFADARKACDLGTQEACAVLSRQTQ